MSARDRREALLAEIETALRVRQPQLKIVERATDVVVEGWLALRSAQGPFDQYQVRIRVGRGFPWIEPRVFETGERIPQIVGRHINPDHSCCLGVWEEWLAKASDTSFGSFLSGPVHDFFLSQ